MRGKDNLGVHLLLIADHMNRELPFSPSPSTYSETNHEDYRKSRVTIAWTVAFCEV